MNEHVGSFGYLTEDNLPYGEVEVKVCYHVFIVWIHIIEEEDGGWEVSEYFDLLAFGQGMSGNIHKSCRCMSKSDMRRLRFWLRAAGIGGGITSQPGDAGGTIYMGYEVEEKGNCPPKECECNENIDLGGMRNNDGYWTDSNGTLHPFDSTDFRDVIEDIITEEALLQCDCD